MIDTKQLYEAAKQSLSQPDPDPVIKCDDMGKIVSYQATLIDRDRARMVLMLMEHYESLLASERSKVISEVREFLNESYRIPCPDDGAEWFVKKLDSMAGKVDAE